MTTPNRKNISPQRFFIAGGITILLLLVSVWLWPDDKATSQLGPTLQHQPQHRSPVREKPSPPPPTRTTYGITEGDGVVFDPNALMLHCETPFLDDGLPVTIRMHAPLAVRNDLTPAFATSEQIVDVTDGALSLSFHADDWSRDMKQMWKTGARVPSIPLEFLFPDGSTQVVPFPSDTMCPKAPQDAKREIAVEVVVRNYDVIDPQERWENERLQGYVAGVDNCGRQVPVVEGRASIKQELGTTCPVRAYRWDGTVMVQSETIEITFDEQLDKTITFVLPDEIHGSLEFELDYHDDGPPTLGNAEFYCDISSGALEADLLVDAELLEVNGTSLRELRKDPFTDHELHNELFFGPIEETKTWTIRPEGFEHAITFEATPCRAGISQTAGTERIRDLVWLQDLTEAYAQKR